MKTGFLIAAIAAISAPLPAVAQAPQPAIVSPPVDPARLAAARAVIDQVFPPATREQMMKAMMVGMTTNIRQALTSNPQFATAIGSDPRVKTLFDTFMDRQLARTTATMNAGLPGMSEAMARAYARRFDIAQLHDLSVFFATPTGQAYTRLSMTIMSDPDIAAWQRGLMAQSMSHTQSDVADLMKQISALKPPVKSQ